MKTAVIILTVLAITSAWPTPEFINYARNLYPQPYVVDHAMPYDAPPAAALPAYSNQEYQGPALIRSKRQMMGGMGTGMAGAQAQAQAQSVGSGMGMGGMGGFPYMMGYPFMG
jgi:hypothetical protein